MAAAREAERARIASWASGACSQEFSSDDEGEMELEENAGYTRGHGMSKQSEQYDKVAAMCTQGNAMSKQLEGWQDEGREVREEQEKQVEEIVSPVAQVILDTTSSI